MIKILTPSFELKEPNLASMSESEKEECSRRWRSGMISIIKEDDEALARYLV